MAGCKYTFMGEKLTYQELVSRVYNAYKNNEIDFIKDVSDVLFSKTDDPGAKQRKVIDRVKELKDNYNNSGEYVSPSSPCFDDGPRIKGSENVVSVQDFINSKEFNPGGEENIFVLDRDNFRKYTLGQYKASKISEEDGKRMIDDTLNNWDKSCENARDFHYMMMKNNDKTGQSVWNTDADKTAFATVKSKLSEIQKSIYGTVRMRNPSNKVDSTSLYTEIIKNVNLSAKMEDGKTMIGHLDYVAVREDGSLDLYNIKTSTDPSQLWSYPKWENYRYEMAFLKQMLAHNGLDVSKARVNIIPVHFGYNVDEKTGKKNYNSINSVDVQKVVSLDTEGGHIANEKHDLIASDYISSTFNEKEITVDFIPEVDRILNVAFHEPNIKAIGIRTSAEEWVRQNWNRLIKRPIKGGKGWYISLVGTNLSASGIRNFEVSDPNSGTRNNELVKKIEEIMGSNLKSGYGSRVGEMLKSDFIDSFKKYGFFQTTVRGVDADYLRIKWNKYFMTKKEEEVDGRKVFTYDWRILDSPALDLCNMIALQHKSGQVDFIAFSEMDLDQLHKFGPGHDNLLGAYLHDANDENFNLRSDYGNIELMRNIAIINYLAPQLEGNVKLGDLSIISLANHSGRKGMTVSFRSASKYWNTFMRVLNTKTSGEAALVDNLSNGKISLVSEEENLIREWMNIISIDKKNVDITALKDLKEILETHVGPDGRTINGLLDSKTIANKKIVLKEYLRRLKELLGGRNYGVYVSDTKQLVRLANEPYMTEQNLLSRLYISAAKLLGVYEGDVNLQNQDMNWMQMNFIKSTSSRNDNVRRVGQIVQSGIDAIRDRMADVYYADLRPIFEKLYKDAGYSKLRNTLIGDQTVVYKNMFERGDNGENLFIFKNPYESDSDLKDFERDFLKKILFEFYKVRCRMKHEKPVISGIEDSALYNDMPEDYLYVPLQKASIVSKRSNIKNEIESLSESLHRVISDPIGTWNDFVAKLKDNSHNTQVEKAMKNMQTVNPYSRTEGDTNERVAELNGKGAKYFETDVENIFIDYLFAQTRCEEMDNLLYRINAIELALRLKGIDEYNDATAAKINETVDFIEKYLKVNVYEGSIMDKAGQILEKSLKGLRRFTSEVLLGNAPANWMRDMIQYTANNFASVIIKYKTDLKFKTLTRAYKYVWLDVLKSIKGMSILEQLNTRYGISSFDASKVSSKLKTQGGAMLDEQKWIYWSMKNPDYINRMVLFVARAQQDGAWDAYGLDEHGSCKYNWRKDKRFSLLAKGNAGKRENAAEYNKQFGKYCDMIDQFNNERPERNLTYADDLPDAYTAKEIKAIKSLAENLYGAYDKASKGMLENMALGRNFAWFITWFNGIADTYVGPTRIDTSSVKWKQMTNEKGELLYRDTETGELTTEKTEIPAYEEDNVTTTSVARELKSMFQILGSNGFDIKDYYNRNVKDNEEVKQLYRKLCLDMSVTALFSLLLGLVVKPAYKQFKSQADGERFFQNVCVELLYRGWSRAFDVFSGPLVILKYFGDSTNPVYYDMGNKMITDLYKVVAGKEAFGSTLLSYSALYRNMQDSYKMWVKTHKDQLDIE